MNTWAWFSLPALVVFPSYIYLFFKRRRLQPIAARNVTNSIMCGVLEFLVILFITLDQLHKTRPHIFDVLACFALLPTLVLNLELKALAINVRYNSSRARVFLSAPPTESTLMLGTKDDEWYLQHESLGTMETLNKYSGIALLVHLSIALIVWVFHEEPLNAVLGFNRIVVLIWMLMLSVRIMVRLYKLTDVKDAFWLKNEIKWTACSLLPTVFAISMVTSAPSLDFVSTLLTFGAWSSFFVGIILPVHLSLRVWNAQPRQVAKSMYPLKGMLEDELNKHRFKAYLMREFSAELLYAWREAHAFRMMVLNSPHLKADGLVGNTMCEQMERLYRLYLLPDAPCRLKSIAPKLIQRYQGDFGLGGRLLLGREPGETHSSTGKCIDEDYFEEFETMAMNELEPAYVRFCATHSFVFLEPLNCA